MTQKGGLPIPQLPVLIHEVPLENLIHVIKSSTDVLVTKDSLQWAENLLLQQKNASLAGFMQSPTVLIVSLLLQFLILNSYYCFLENKKGGTVYSRMLGALAKIGITFETFTNLKNKVHAALIGSNISFNPELCKKSSRKSSSKRRKTSSKKRRSSRRKSSSKKRRSSSKRRSSRH